ncbi:MAG: cation:proton antiporter, partial [Candidatus Promineifilaceae bacterium]|nr:cation:proton antiporter [Candidatus Promineifilaceae bacterium]
MNELRETLALLAAFAMIALASREIGRLALRTSLPLISGFLLAGIIAGPYVLGLIPEEVAQRLRFLDQVSLAFIAFAAGSELYVRELRGRFRSISRITLGNALIVPVLGAVTLYLVSDLIPFLHESGTEVRVAAALLTGAILVARSPSSVIAIVNELRA